MFEQRKTNVITHGNVIKTCKRTPTCTEKASTFISQNRNAKTSIHSNKSYRTSDALLFGRQHFGGVF